MTFSFGLPSGPPPNPTHFSNLPGSPAPTGSGIPGASSPESQMQALQVAAMNNPDLAGVLQTIGSVGGDVAGFLGKFLPKNADGSIDWGGVGGDVMKWLSDNKGNILAGASIYESAVRQGKSDAAAQAAVTQATNDYAAKAPLRTAGIAGMLDPKAGTPDLSKLNAMATAGQSLTAPTPLPLGQNMGNLQQLAGAGSGNPFAKPLPMAAAPGAPVVPSAPGGPTPPPGATTPPLPGRPTLPPDAPRVPQAPPKLTIPLAPPGPLAPITPGAPPVTPTPPKPGMPGIPLAPLAPLTPGAPGVLPSLPGIPLPPRPPGMQPPAGWALPLAQPNPQVS